MITDVTELNSLYPSDNTFTVELTLKNEAARALVKLMENISYDDVRQITDSDAETAAMMMALDSLAEQLSRTS
ncbi:hypothetical protein D6O16_23310 [Salmonella enterica]|nr:hypothetical protein [Salmonella enterica subsp. enterica serovar Sandiego]EAP1707845.1 hypothetical protein [Salmonella enterica]ECT6519944.1 hypothetical protein [Salmonella enterica]EDX8941818.1 hypothetical protein [Salmonella enterica subsp. enterica serovar Aba]EIY0670578.1 hypothetical protein [Salmonella enterica]